MTLSSTWRRRIEINNYNQVTSSRVVVGLKDHGNSEDTTNHICGSRIRAIAKILAKIY